MTSTATWGCTEDFHAEASPSRNLLLPSCLVVANGRTNESLQRTFFSAIPFINVNGPPLVARQFCI